MRLIPVLATLAILPAAEASAQITVEDLCTRATMTAAANGEILWETFAYGGIDRHVCTYRPSAYAPGSPHPLLIALHGGSGNASQMMEDGRAIIAAAETMGAIALFPNGLPRESCAGTPCLDNNWGGPENLFFIAELIGRQKALGEVEDDRVHLVGFSGGARLIYEIAAMPGFPHALHSVATMAGAFGVYSTERPDEGFVVIPLEGGTPVSALLAQGGADPRLPASGGLDKTTREAHVSFRTKVDFWRLVTGTEDAAPSPVPVQTHAPTAPADVEAFRYTDGGLTVIEVLDPGLEHEWPDWDLMAVAVELFER